MAEKPQVRGPELTLPAARVVMACASEAKDWDRGWLLLALARRDLRGGARKIARPCGRGRRVGWWRRGRLREWRRFRGKTARPARPGAIRDWPRRFLGSWRARRRDRRVGWRGGGIFVCGRAFRIGGRRVEIEAGLGGVAGRRSVEAEDFVVGGRVARGERAGGGGSATGVLRGGRVIGEVGEDCCVGGASCAAVDVAGIWKTSIQGEAGDVIGGRSHVRQARAANSGRPRRVREKNVAIQVWGLEDG